MKSIPLYQIDAFTDSVFGGNPAAVCVLENWIDDKLLQNIASENFLPETAFIVKSGLYNTYDLRWFTPEIEMDLCGHATLASAFVIFNFLNTKIDSVEFNTQSGKLIVTRENDLLTLDFPSRIPVKAELPKLIIEGIGLKPLEVFKARDYVLVYENEEIIKNINPNQELLNQINLDPGGIIVTAPGNKTDFVSRFFTPQASIFEDPVTGSAHCSLIPLWSHKLKKLEMTALQLSKRGGKILCKNQDTRILISGKCKTFLIGIIHIE
ncbi:MAG: PhzF family phenazine biosynthesis protein [Bacteroidota bacterium]